MRKIKTLLFGIVALCFAANMAHAQTVYAVNSSVYPFAATAVTNSSADVAAASAVATLAAASGKTTYISGFSCTSTGSTAAATVDIVVAGVLGGTLKYVQASVAGATLANAPTHVSYNPPLPASAANTAITVTMPSLGTGNLHAACVATGFQK